eukprot:scaffold370761_cov20-Attheya_sp.AAC.1
MELKNSPSSSSSSSSQQKVEPGGDDDEDGDEKSNSWLTWMTGGKRSKRAWGVEEIKMREDVAWGGVPRADRYSS